MLKLMKMAVCPLTVKKLSQQYACLSLKNHLGLDGMVGEMCKRLWSALIILFVFIINA